MKIKEEIGWKIKQLRKERGLSQNELADRINLTHQQVQKYEKGANIYLHRLIDILKALEVSMTDFLKQEKTQKVSEKEGSYNVQKRFLQRLTKEELTLVKLFRKINNKKIRSGLLEHLKGIGETETENKNLINKINKIKPEDKNLLADKKQ